MNQREIEFFAQKEQDARADRESDRAEQMQQEDEPPTCKCKRPDGKPFNVNLIVSGGSIAGVVCASCELECVESHDLEFLEGEAVPARLTVTTETYDGPDGTEHGYFLVLDAQPYEGDL